MDETSEPDDVIEERRRKAQEIAAERSKALIEPYRPPFGAESVTDDGEDDADD